VYLVGDGLCDGVPVRTGRVPVRLADEQNHTRNSQYGQLDHTRSDAGEETEGRAQTEGCHLRHSVTAAAR